MYTSVCTMDCVNKLVDAAQNVVYLGTLFAMNCVQEQVNV